MFEKIIRIGYVYCNTGYSLSYNLICIISLKIHVIAYDAQWAVLFESESRRLTKLWPDKTLSIEHIGSTAVPGLAAKPVVDILIGTDDMIELQAMVSKLTDADYRYIPEYEKYIPERRFFIRPKNNVEEKSINWNPDYGARDHLFHIHAAARTSPFWGRHITFRDVLRRDKALRDAYADLKYKLSENVPEDKNTYAQGKFEFIQAVGKKLGVQV